MGKKLYVGNLPYSATEGSLEGLFGEVGTVESAKVISDRFSGRSKGFGFVEMSTEEEAAQAIERFNDTDMEGRTIKVSEARPPTQNRDRDRDRGGHRGGGGGGGNRHR